MECLHRVYKLIWENVALGLNAFWQNVHNQKRSKHIVAIYSTAGKIDLLPKPSQIIRK